MAFREVRYYPAAEEGLIGLDKQGAFEELLRQIATIKQGWEPEDIDDPQCVIP